MLLPVTLRQPQFLIRSLLRLLDKSVQQHHPAHPVDIKDHSRNSVLGQAGANLIEPATLRTQTGIPMGQPNSTVRMSAPIRFLSSRGKLFSHSRTGSLPASVR